MSTPTTGEHIDTWIAGIKMDTEFLSAPYLILTLTEPADIAKKHTILLTNGQLRNITWFSFEEASEELDYGIGLYEIAKVLNALYADSKYKVISSSSVKHSSGDVCYLWNLSSI